jgi:opacity protein-like surface antigen
MTFAMERDAPIDEPRPSLSAATLLAALALSCALVGAAHAGPADPARDESSWRIEVAALGGAVQLDERLADYQWDVSPRTAWGAEASVGRSRFAGGVRIWTSTTRQNLDPTVASASPLVRSTSAEMVVRGRVAERWRSRLMATASGGWLHLGYDPDRLEVDGGSGPVTVDLAPIDTWVMGGGFGVERWLGERWLTGFEVDHRIFDLDAAHQSGGATVVSRERFGDWNFRFRLARAFR